MARKKIKKYRKGQQTELIPKPELSFGGSLLKNSHARMPRPIDSKNFLHIVLKSDAATGDKKFTKKKVEVLEKIHRRSHDYGLKIRKVAVASNHIHILVQLRSRRRFIAWLRGLTGVLARLMLGAEKGKAKLNSKQDHFWNLRPFTRVVFWGRDCTGVENYIGRNILEAIGFIAYTPRAYKIINSTA